VSEPTTDPSSPDGPEGAPPWLYPSGLAFARFRLQLKVVERASFPADKGAMLRHGLLHSLRQHPCVEGQGRCPLRSLPLPFVLTPPADERTWYYTAENWTGHLVVAAPATDHMRCLIRALDWHLRQELPAAGYSKVLLEQVDLLDPRDQQHTSFYFTKERKLKTRAVPYTHALLHKRAALLAGRTRLTVRFVTPLRTTAPLGDAPAAWVELLGASLARMQAASASLIDPELGLTGAPSAPAPMTAMPPTPSPEELALLRIDSADLRWTQRSTRVFEASGSLCLHGPLDRLSLALIAGQHLHLGRGAAVGFGRYELKP
jgi:hypothetical protein